MSVLAVASPKGGVGKTTVALNLAFAFATRRWRTVLVDADPQGAIGLSLTQSLRDRLGVADCVTGSVEPVSCVVRTRLKTLALLPRGRPPSDPDWSASLGDGRQMTGLLAPLVHHFDIVLVDTACGFTGATLGVLRNCDQIVLPVSADPLALRSTLECFDVLAKLRESGAAAKVAGLLLTMMSTREEIPLNVAQELWRLLPDRMVLETVVPRDPVFLEASAEGVPVGLLRQPAPPMASVFERVAVELEPRLNLRNGVLRDAPVYLLD